ncbi:MAG: ATP-binding cassette domain-containing protein [Fimbriimonadales bacterium]|nr:ATP-binding cassette domain-containing protein [Fimbriimonadales bacterium]
MNGPRSVLTAKDLGLRPGWPPLSFSVEPGDRVAVLGPAGGGKTSLLQALAHAEPPRGCVQRAVETVLAELPRIPPLATPQGLTQKVRGSKPSPSALAEALTALGLWAVRKTPISRLSPSQRVAAQLLPFLALPPGVLLVDGLLEELDPWAARNTLELIDRLCADGMALVAATRQPRFAEAWDGCVVIAANGPVYVGAIAPLRDRLREIRALVTRDEQRAARALMEPFQVRVEQRDGYTWLIAPAGQETAARLITEGYGEVEAVAVRNPSLLDALLDLLPSP